MSLPVPTLFHEPGAATARNSREGGEGSEGREAGRFFGKNSATIFELGREALATRAQGQAFTSEQVGRWARALPPLMSDVNLRAVDICRREVSTARSTDSVIESYREMNRLRPQTI